MLLDRSAARLAVEALDLPPLVLALFDDNAAVQDLWYRCRTPRYAFDRVPLYPTASCRCGSAV